MKKFEKINAIDIQNALNNNHRQYLTGVLKLPQQIKEIIDENIEVGISKYKNATYEEPHYHTEVSEYQYVLNGMTEYLDLDTKEIHRFKKGDFYVIRAHTKYAQRIKQNTEILFFKYPGKNDKITLNMNNQVSEWLKEPLRVKRIDFNNDSNMPIPNTIIPAVSVAIINDKNEILFLKRTDSGNWTIPGGTIEFGEDLISCGKREVKEETGLDIEIVDLIGTYSNPKNVVYYDDGEIRQEFTLMYLGNLISNKDIKIDDESTNYEWVSKEDALNLKLAKSQLTRVNDLIKYLKDGTKSFK